MTPRTLLAVPFALAAVAILVPGLAYVDVWLTIIRVLPAAMSLFLAALLVLVVPTLFRCAASAEARRRVGELLVAHRSVLLPLAGCVFFAFLSAFQPAAYWDEGSRYTVYSAYDAVIVVLSMLLVYEAHHRHLMRWYLMGALLLLGGSVLLDAVNPGTFSIVESRAAGFPVNPNTTSFALVALCCAILDFRRVRALDLLMLALTSLGVLLTLSRGGVLLFALLVVGYLYALVRHGEGHPVRALGRVAAIAVLAGVVIYAGAALVGRAKIFSLDDQQRFQTFVGRGPVLDARDERVLTLEDNWRVLQTVPLLGYGSGYTTRYMRQRPHNIYVQQLVEFGVGGLVCFVWLLVAGTNVFRRRGDLRGVVFMAVVAVEGLFSHNLLEERAFIVLFGMLLTTSYFAVRETAPARRMVLAPQPWPVVGTRATK